MLSFEFWVFISWQVRRKLPRMIVQRWTHSFRNAGICSESLCYQAVFPSGNKLANNLFCNVFPCKFAEHCRKITPLPISHVGGRQKGGEALQWMGSCLQFRQERKRSAAFMKNECYNTSDSLGYQSRFSSNPCQELVSRFPERVEIFLPWIFGSFPL